MSNFRQAITFDVDWAPDFMIDAISRQLIEHGVKSTWFVTHESPGIDRLRNFPDLFELGIHPNFNPNSSHGSTTTQVLRNCLEMVPEARCIRSHGLVHSSGLLNELIDIEQLEVDATLILPNQPFLQAFRYHWHHGSIVRIPIYWEDDVGFFDPACNWQLETVSGEEAGLQVFNFHPVHVYLNASQPDEYAILLKRCPDLLKARLEDCRDLIQEGPGAGQVFQELVHKLCREDRGATMSELKSFRLKSHENHPREIL